MTRAGQDPGQQVPHDGSVIAPDDDSVEIFLSPATK